jgi:N-methylhydantoinase A
MSGLVSDAPTVEDAFIGVDVGGTHTDASVVIGDSVERGKALTTYDDFSRGVLEAVGVAAEPYGLALDQLLDRTRLFVNGTTVVTNAITTLTGSRVGVLVTAGFKDTFRITGGPRVAEFDDHLQVNAPDVVRRADLEEIDERVGWDGSELVPLDGDQVRAAVRRLVDGGVDAVAVCFMSSFAAPAHELEAERLINELYPDLFVSASHRVFPVVGETRRWTTAVLNAFVQARARVYLDSLSQNLRDAGLRGGLVFFQGLGGGISLERAKEFPLALLGSGPAGGAIGANALARHMGLSNVLLGDMGGTSFDTGIIVDNEIKVEKNLEVGLLRTGVNLVDVVSVGAGGGSIAWVGERGVPQVGPQSAGSDPGPASYGTGGTDPTVTDAMVVLGFIDPERYLGGRFQLHPALAGTSLDRDLTTRFGWSKEEAAAAIHDLVVMNMATAVHEVSVAKGYDPRDFVFLAYGGTLPLFAVQIADRLNISRVVIPQNSSVFSALGLLSADFVMRYDQTVAWGLGADRIDEVNRIADSIVGKARAAMGAEGFSDDQIAVSKSGDFRFLGQSYELTMGLPDAPLSAEDAPELAQRFLELYERTYGEGTAWKGVPVQLLNYTVTVTGRQPRRTLQAVEPAPRVEEDLRLGTRRVFLPTERQYRDLPIYDDARFTAGTRIAGPAIVDAIDTTIYIPPGSEAARDEYMNYVLTTDGVAR